MDRRVPEERVVVEVHLRVESDHVARPRDEERVDLGERRVRRDVRLRERDQEADGLLVRLALEAERVRELARLVRLQAPRGLERLLDDGIGVLRRDDLDLHAALPAHHHDGPADRAVERDPEVELLGDVQGLLDEDLLDLLPVRAGLVRHELHPEDLAGEGFRLLGALRELDAAALAAAPRVDLRLDDGAPAELLRDPTRLFRRVRHAPAGGGDAEPAENFFRLVFVDFHGDGGQYQNESGTLHE